MRPGSLIESLADFLFAGVLLLGILGAFDVFGATATHFIAVGNELPTVSGVTLNHGNPITLTPNTTTSVDVNFTISDNNGCRDVFSSGTVSIYLYRSSVGSSSAAGTSSALNAYRGSLATSSCAGGSVSGAATATVDLWYFAEATDASSSFAAQTWIATVRGTDASSASSTADSSGVELSTLLAIDISTSTIQYGTVLPGTNTGSSTTAVPVLNVGNSSTTITISGTALASGGNFIATSSQHFATSSFTYGGGEQVLSGVAQAVNGLLMASPPMSRFSTSTPLPVGNEAAAAVVYKDYIFNIGGSNTSSVGTAPLLASGTIGAWSAATTLPSPREFHAAVVHNGYVYVLGGSTGGNLTSTVLYANAYANGTLGAWAETTPLPAGIELAAAAAYNGMMYLFGGADLGGPTSTVWYAPINSSGTLGAWSATSPLSTSTYGHAALISSAGYAYVLGGANGPFSALSDTAFAKVQGDGTLGSWVPTASMRFLRYGLTAALDGNIIYAAGGCAEGDSCILVQNITLATEYATVTATGSLASWSPGQNLSSRAYLASGALNNGYLYMLGGDNGSFVATTTQFSPLASRNIYWGASVSSTQAAGSYTGTVTFTAVFSP
jgi:hypothetical protein